MKTVDSILGEITYDSGWEKQENLMVLGRETSLLIYALAYQGEDILEIQRACYQQFKSNMQLQTTDIMNALEIYLQKVEPHQSWQTLRDQIHPYMLYLDRDGSYGLLCHCDWSPDDGIAIQLNDGIKIGCEDMLL